MEQSPSTEHLVDIGSSRHQQHNNNEFVETHYIWRSCCGMLLDKRVLVFSSQFLITLMIISFSLFQLSIDNTCEHQQFYASLITMLIGIYLPSPRVK
jgi:hypothetical protein